MNEGQQSRQFIHLVPGKEYDVSVWGKTCGNGQIANLKSSLLSDKIVIPPESPANARFKSRDSNEIEICFKGPAEGYFTGFDFLWENSAGETGYQYLQVNDEGTFRNNFRTKLRPPRTDPYHVSKNFKTDPGQNQPSLRYLGLQGYSSQKDLKLPISPT